MIVILIYFLWTIPFIFGSLQLHYFRKNTEKKQNLDGTITITTYEKGRLVKAVKQFTNGQINEAYLTDSNNPDRITKFIFKYNDTVLEIIKGVPIDIVKGNIKFNSKSITFGNIYNHNGNLNWEKDAGTGNETKTNNQFLSNDHSGYIKIYFYKSQTIERYFISDEIKFREKQFFKDGKIIETYFLENGFKSFSSTTLPSGEFIEEEFCFNTGLKRSLTFELNGNKIESTTHKDGSTEKLWFENDELIKVTRINSVGSLEEFQV